VNYLVTGTDTGVGKTFVTTGIIRSARMLRIDCVGVKPICTGDNRDVLEIAAACNGAEPEYLLNPIWYRTPVAPYTAALIENRFIDLSAIRSAFETLSRRHSPILVEGVGGIAVPIQADYDFRDLAKDLNLEVIVVAPNRLGVLNHTRLTVAAIHSAGLSCSLVLLNSAVAETDISQSTNLSVLENLLEVPIIGIERDQNEFEDIIRKLDWKVPDAESSSLRRIWHPAKRTF
jgi:dethiobiotin synthetase